MENKGFFWITSNASIQTNSVHRQEQKNDLEILEPSLEFVSKQDIRLLLLIISHQQLFRQTERNMIRSFPNEIMFRIRVKTINDMTRHQYDDSKYIQL